MEMHEIQYFLAVCDTLHSNRAAERCHVSQPACEVSLVAVAGRAVSAPAAALIQAVETYTWSAELAV